MFQQARLFNVCSIDSKEKHEYVHGFYVKVDLDRLVLPKEYVDLRAATYFATECSNFKHDRDEAGKDVGWRSWWVLLCDEVHHKLLQLGSEFTGHQLEFDIRHIATGLTRSAYVDQGGDPQDLLDPWQWMISRYSIQVLRATLRDSGVSKYGGAEQHFLCVWSCVM
jgi:hypothetical protein